MVISTVEVDIIVDVITYFSDTMFQHIWVTSSLLETLVLMQCSVVISFDYLEPYLSKEGRSVYVDRLYVCRFVMLVVR